MDSEEEVTEAKEEAELEEEEEVDLEEEEVAGSEEEVTGGEASLAPVEDSAAEVKVEEAGLVRSDSEEEATVVAVVAAVGLEAADLEAAMGSKPGQK